LPFSPIRDNSLTFSIERVSPSRPAGNDDEMDEERMRNYLPFPRLSNIDLQYKNRAYAGQGVPVLPTRQINEGDEDEKTMEGK
jgi:hypothetical protein